WCCGLLDRAARGDDLLLGGAGDLVDRDVELHLDVDVAEHLAALVLADGPLVDEVGDGDVAALRVELGELLQVDHLVLDTERVLEAAQLRRTHVVRKLATLETGADVVAGLRTLGAATGGLALRPLTASDAGLVLLGPRRGAEGVHL